MTSTTIPSVESGFTMSLSPAYQPAYWDMVLLQLLQRTWSAAFQSNSVLWLASAEAFGARKLTFALGMSLSVNLKAHMVALFNGISGRWRRGVHSGAPE